MMNDVIISMCNAFHAIVGSGPSRLHDAPDEVDDHTRFSTVSLPPSPWFATVIPLLTLVHEETIGLSASRRFVISGFAACGKKKK